MWLCIFYSFWLLYGWIDLIIVWIFPTFQAASGVSHRFPGLSLYAKEQICLIQEEIACLDKVSFKLESEMQVAIKMKGQYFPDKCRACDNTITYHCRTFIAIITVWGCFVPKHMKEIWDTCDQNNRCKVWTCLITWLFIHSERRRLSRSFMDLKLLWRVQETFDGLLISHLSIHLGPCSYINLVTLR